MIAPMSCEHNADARCFSSHTPIHYTVSLVCGSTRKDFFSGFTRRRIACGDIEINTVAIDVCGRALPAGHDLAEEVPDLVYVEFLRFFE